MIRSPLSRNLVLCKGCPSSFQPWSLIKLACALDHRIIFSLLPIFCQSLKKLAQLPKQLSSERNADVSPSRQVLYDSFFSLQYLHVCALCLGRWGKKSSLSGEQGREVNVKVSWWLSSATVHSPSGSLDCISNTSANTIPQVGHLSSHNCTRWYCHLLRNRRAIYQLGALMLAHVEAKPACLSPREGC